MPIEQASNLEQADFEFRAPRDSVFFTSVRVFDMSVGEAASIQARCPMWTRNRLRRYDKAAPIPSWFLPDADCPKVSQIRLDTIISKTSC